MKGVGLKSETSWTMAAPHLHVPRSDSDFEAEILRSPTCVGLGRRVSVEEKLGYPWGVKWFPVLASVCSPVNWGSIEKPPVGGLLTTGPFLGVIHVHGTVKVLV